MKCLLRRNFGNCLPVMHIHILGGQTLPLRHTGDDVRKQEAATTIFSAVRKSLCVGEQIILDQLNIRNYEIIFFSVFNQLYAQNLFHNKFYFMTLHVSSTWAHHQELKIALHSLWYHHTYRWPSRAPDLK
jgi:hypothetical protein